MPGSRRPQPRQDGMHSQDPPSCTSTRCAFPKKPSSASTVGVGHLVTNLAQERLSIAVAGVAAARAALDWTVAYVRDRTAFGQSIGSFQNTRFALATLATEVEVGQSFIDHCITALGAGTLSAEDPQWAKWWAPSAGPRRRRGVRLHGGRLHGDYPIDGLADAES